MLKCISRPDICYDLIGLATDGLVSVGRESESLIRLDSNDVPYLLSRKHGSIQFLPDGSLQMRDLNSTNGTYAGRRDEALIRLPPDTVWRLEAGDTIGFGGPESILVHDDYVNNPFQFKFYPIDIAAVEGSALLGGTDEQRIRSEQAPEVSQQSPPRPRQVSANDDTCGVSHSGRVLDSTPRSPLLECDALHPSSRDQSSKENQQRGAGPQTPKTPTGKKMKEILHSHLTCPICQEWLLACHALPCGHMFCGLCLATWLEQKHSCPACRKPVKGIPVRCFQVDGTINDLLGINLMSPCAKQERKRKQALWEDIQDHVIQDWSTTLHSRKQQALSAAIRYHRSLMQTAQTAVDPDGLASITAPVGRQPVALSTVDMDMDLFAAPSAGGAPPAPAAPMIRQSDGSARISLPPVPSVSTNEPGTARDASFFMGAPGAPSLSPSAPVLMGMPPIASVSAAPSARGYFVPGRVDLPHVSYGQP